MTTHYGILKGKEIRSVTRSMYADKITLTFKDGTVYEITIAPSPLENDPYWDTEPALEIKEVK